MASQLFETLRYRFDATVMSCTPNPAAVNDRVDREVCRVSLPGARGSGRVLFTDWCRHAGVVVWTHFPHAEQVHWANKQKMFTVYVATEYPADDNAAGNVLSEFGRVLAVDNTTASVLARKFSLDNVVSCPWSPMRQVTVKTVTPSPPRVYVPVTHGTTVEREGDAVEVAAAFLESSYRIKVTLAYSDWGAPSRYAASRMAASVGPSLTVERMGDYSKHLARLAAHDLTVVTDPFEPAGMTGLLSLHMGTPVLAMALPPVSEYSHQARNAFLVPEGPGNLAAAAAALAEEPSLFVASRTSTSTGLVLRRKAYEKVWASILTTACRH